MILTNDKLEKNNLMDCIIAIKLQNIELPITLWKYFILLEYFLLHLGRSLVITIKHLRLQNNFNANRICEIDKIDFKNSFLGNICNFINLTIFGVITFTYFNFTAFSKNPFVPPCFIDRPSC